MVKKMCKSSRKYSYSKTGWVVALILLVSSGSVMAQVNETLDAVEQAMVQGDARTLLSDAADRIEITILGRSTLYSRAQATYVMQDFFREYPPTGFSLDDTSATGGSRFATGRYRYQQAEQPLHVYLQLRKKGTQWQLREIRIEQRTRGD